jgi:HEXXH motif-containing protein
MIRTHTLSVDQFAALATGGGDEEAVAVLRTSQLSKNIVLLRAIMQVASWSCPDEYAASGFVDGFALLEEVQRRAPDAVAEVLVHPQVGAWAAQCLRAVMRPVADAALRRTILSHLAAVAAAAAIRARQPFAIGVSLTAGALMLPTLGLVTLDSRRTGRATIDYVEHRVAVSMDDERIELPVELSHDAPGWQAMRWLITHSAGLRLAVHLDDLGPYRSGGELTVTGRADADTVARWQELIREAWRLLVILHPECARAVAAGLASLVPLEPGGSALDSSATSRDAFGAVMLVQPRSAELFAETLVHEFQHSKLDAVLDLVPLYEAGDEELFYSPARDDPRPLGGMLQGAYAYVGVADFWRRYGRYTSSAHARLEFSRWREQVERVSIALLDTGRLTKHGDGFVSGMLEQARAWEEAAASAEQRTFARDAADDHYLRWRMHNVHPDADNVSALARAWLSGRRPPHEYVPPPPRPASVMVRVNPRLRLRQLAHLRSESPGPRTFEAIDDTPAPSPADLAYIDGDNVRAISLYLKQIDREPANIEHWAGLPLARRHVADDGANRVLLRSPELVRAVYLTALPHAGDGLDPIAVAAWLDDSEASEVSTWPQQFAVDRRGD